MENAEDEDVVIRGRQPKDNIGERRTTAMVKYENNYFERFHVSKFITFSWVKMEKNSITINIL